MTSPGADVVPELGFPGLDPAWSRRVVAPDHRGVEVTWHLLDTHATADAADVDLTVLCVHGNPTWSYLWRSVLSAAPGRTRVIAVDQLDMGWSDRTGVTRRLADRVDDLWALTEALGDADAADAPPLAGPIVVAAHDWGGPVSLGWALRRRAADVAGPSRSTLAGVVLTNTAVHQPPDALAPRVIRLVRRPQWLRHVTATSTTFIRGALEMCRPRPSADVRRAYLAPYSDTERRAAIEQFVADIPLEDEHPSRAALDTIATGLGALAEVPVALLWGPSDPVFGEIYLHDFEQRLPHADVHRFVGAHHLLHEEADVAGVLHRWIDASVRAAIVQSAVGEPGSSPDRGPAGSLIPLGAGIELAASRGGDLPFVAEISDGSVKAVSATELSQRVRTAARRLDVLGVRPGERVALLIPPGIELDEVLYGCWEHGAVPVLVDSGLGPSNMARALRGAAPSTVIGIDRGVAAATALGVGSTRVVVGEVAPPLRRALRGAVRWSDVVETDSSAGRDAATSSTQAVLDGSADADAAVVFTSGSTGPSKGVRYSTRALAAQRDRLAATYRITNDDRLVAAFAPFALYGPALGIPSVVPDMDITKPSTLTAAALADAVEAVDATLVFASPAALANVVATGETVDPERFADVRLVLSAGAPISPALLRSAAPWFPNASFHTPYGMTEVLPVADVSLEEVEEAVALHGDERGVCVGHPVPGVEVRIAPIEGADGWGEIEILAPHRMAGYDRLWDTDSSARAADGWHRSGDVGSIDPEGRLWVSGRVAHVIETAAGPVAPVPIELAAASSDEVALAAAVGVGPVGRQVLAVIVQPTSPRRRVRRGVRLAAPSTAAAVRAAVGRLEGLDVAMVLELERLPVDRRHHSKIDRAALAALANAAAEGR